MPEKPADDAVSEIIAFLLIFAIVVLAAALLVLINLPAQGTAAEAEHDNLVMDQIADLKNSIDLLWTTNSTGVNETHLISMSPTQATDLARRLFIAPTLGSGLLQTGNGTSFIFESDNAGSHYASLLRFTYASDNKYAPDYTIVYDGGAVFYGETDKTTYLLLSPISGANPTGNEEIYLVNATYNTVKTTVGNLPVAVECTYTGRTTYTGVKNLTFAESMYSESFWTNKTALGDVRGASPAKKVNITLLEYNITWSAV
ncbi:MAG: hypothetical protein Q4Q04_05840 [Methanocorpusculum sp.]|nr:hypothetical protein [Methanocorpusculum sp.]